MPWPVVSDFQTYLQTIPESNVSDSYDYQGALDSAVRKFQDQTGRQGFLGDGSTVSVLYNPPDGRSGRLLLYIDDFYEIDAVACAVNSANPAGRVLTLDVDYALLPDNPSGWAFPFERIEFFCYLGFERRSVKVTGKRGYQSDVPPDVFEGILEESSAVALTNSVGTAGSIKQDRQGERSRSYETSHTTIDRLHEAFDAKVARYLKIGAV